MRTTFIPNTPYRAAVTKDSLFIFDDAKDQLILCISPITASKEELLARNFDSVIDFQNTEIKRIIEAELQLESINISHLFSA